MSAAPLRFGILGAARIAPNALVNPAHIVPEVRVMAVAARDRARAQAFARRHNIPRVAASYDALVNDPDLDAIYNPLPNAFHCEWTLKALRAGKHVLCEKPLASNAREAQEMANVADEAGRVLMEAFHYRYHPLARAVEAILARGDIGRVTQVEVDFFIPLFFRPADIRFNFALAGGATMDTGSYCINLIRWLGGGEPQVEWAQAQTGPKNVDRVMHARFRFDNGVRARMGCSLAGFPPVKLFASVRGEQGEIKILNPFVPQYFNRLEMKTAAGTERMTVSREPTYNFQLRAFLGAVRGACTNLTDGHAGARNMQVIDAVYGKAGLPLRGT